jgi:NADPH-dependent 2,4-dienoyl-CoA reductase/sulfur reductase-like enzyme
MSLFTSSAPEPAAAPPAPPKVQVVPAAQGKKTCCVIGAGASGLTVMKELTALGHSVRFFFGAPRDACPRDPARARRV